MFSALRAMVLVLVIGGLALLGAPASRAAAPDDYRIDANRDANSFTLGVDEPLQVHVNQGQARTFSFSRPVTGVISRNSTVASLTVVSGAILARGLIPGRTGMRITFDDRSTLFMGLRVDNADGSLPGLPGPVALGSVSDDGADDVAFWQSDVPGPAGTRIDIRYIYLNGGPFEGWATWGERVKTYTKNSLLWGMIPFFVFYNIPDGEESYTIDLANVNDFFYMAAYWDNLNLFLTQAQAVMQGELYGAVLEPDFLGYMQQQSGKQPSEITTADGTLVDTVTRINQTIAENGGNIFFGWQLNLWADPSITYAKGVIRITDTEGWAPGRTTIVQAATNTVNYAIAAGVLSHGADFLSIDKYGLDAGASNPDNPSESTWFWNNDHWMNYLLYVNTLSQVSGKPVVLWQLPVGRINSSTTASVRTGQLFPDLPNTITRYEDSSTTFFFGDVFDETSGTRLDYFSQNQAADSTLKVSGGRLTWGSHIALLPQNGVISAMFGAGVGASTHGTGNPPTDDYFWIQKVQMYYLGLLPKTVVPIYELLLQ